MTFPQISRPFWKQHAITLLLPLLLSLAALAGRFQTVALTMDGVTYLQISRNILHGKGLGWQALWVPPLHSVLIAAASFLAGIDDLLRAATVVSVLLGFLLVAAVYFTAYQVFDRKTALISAALAALSPHLLRITFSDEAEITYTFFLTLSLGLLTLALKREAWIYSALAGAGFALAYLARSEGFLVLALVLGALMLLQGRNLFRSGVCAKCVVACVLFVMIASPYLLFLKKNYGAWVISPKTSYVMIWMKCFTYHDNNKGEEGNDELWGLSGSGKLAWQEPKGAGDLLDYLGSHPEKSLAVYLHNLSMELPGRIPNGSGMEGYPQLFPVYLALPALLSLFLAWGPLGREKKCILCAGLAVFFILPVFTSGWWKYLVPYLPIVLILATKGFTGALGWCAAKAGPGNSRHAETILLGAALLAVGWQFTPGLGEKPSPAAPSARPSRKNLVREEAVKAAKYGFQLLGPGHNYMVSWSPVVYYLDGFWTARPVAPLAQQLAYARENGADYYVLDILSDDPGGLPALPGMRMVGLYQSEKTPLKVGFYSLR